MNEKISIVILSGLKPINDTRTYHKIGKSLAQTNKYAINIIGFPVKKKPNHKNIRFSPLPHFKRISILRAFLPFIVFRKTLKVKPKLIVCSSPEFLLVTYLYKIIFGSKIIYDVQENYSLNIQFDPTINKPFKFILKLGIHAIQGISRLFINHYFLAETVYAKQLNFFGLRPYTYLLNKTELPDYFTTTTSVKSFKNISQMQLRFCITGTLGETYGTLEGIEFFKKWNSIHSKSTLYIIGYCADNQYYKEIIKAVNGHVKIYNQTHQEPVLHENILQVLKKSDIALLPYKQTAQLENKIPTKFYDCIACSTVIITSCDDKRQQFIQQYQAGLTLNFHHTNYQELITTLTNSEFFTKVDLVSISWHESEKHKLLSVVDTVLK